MSKTPNSPTEQDTFDWIMCAGATMYSWYRRSEFNEAAKAAAELDSDLDSVTGWEVIYMMENPEEPGEVRVVVNHEAILEACRKIIGTPRPEYITRSAVDNARALLFGSADPDFDANSADEVLQMIAYEEIVFG